MCCEIATIFVSYTLPYNSISLFKRETFIFPSILLQLANVILIFVRKKIFFFFAGSLVVKSVSYKRNGFLFSFSFLQIMTFYIF